MAPRLKATSGTTQVVIDSTAPLADAKGEEHQIAHHDLGDAVSRCAVHELTSRPRSRTLVLSILGGSSRAHRHDSVSSRR